jgi:hypothetical protein
MRSMDANGRGRLSVPLRRGDLWLLRPGVLSTRASHDPDAFAVAGIEQRLDLSRHPAASLTRT